MCRGKQIALLVITLATVSMFLYGTAALAEGKGKGKGKGGNKEPDSLKKSEKKGLEDAVVPRIEKKGGWIPPWLSKEEQAEWKDGRPPGWSSGEKKGWKGAAMPPGQAKKSRRLPTSIAQSGPPGWEKWSDAKKKSWEKELAEAKERVRDRAKKLKGFTEKDLDSSLGSIDIAARKGVPIKNAKGLVEKAMGKGIKGGGIETATKAMTYGVGREVDYDQLGKFVNKKMDEGLRDDELSIEIYKEISQRHEERLKAKEAIQQEKEKEKGSKK